MKRELIEKILEEHSVEFEVVEGRIIATEWVCRNGKVSQKELIDVTDMDYGSLAAWLGY